MTVITDKKAYEKAIPILATDEKRLPRLLESLSPSDRRWVEAAGFDGAPETCVLVPDGKGGVVIQMPNGQLFNTISNGYNTMMGYGAQIPHADRWAIVAYVRALERAQNASLDDVPPDQRGSLR